MDINIYIPEHNDDSDRLVSSIINSAKNTNILIVSNISNIKYNKHTDNINILFISNEDELFSAIVNKQLLIDSKIILILFDKNNHILNIAYLLKPIFIDYQDSSFDHVEAILNKISATENPYPYNKMMTVENRHQGGVQ